ncbi:MAG: hypothetical protein H7251_08775 [Acetobacteraceae bacterium]|nr:hypothetical protein [Acetobacteraceae bacterium]
MTLPSLALACTVRRVGWRRRAKPKIIAAVILYDRCYKMMWQQLPPCKSRWMAA